jgi:hypothetical protein
MDIHETEIKGEAKVTIKMKFGALSLRIRAQ